MGGRCYNVSDIKEFSKHGVPIVGQAWKDIPQAFRERMTLSSGRGG